MSAQTAPRTQLTNGATLNHATHCIEPSTRSVLLLRPLPHTRDTLAPSALNHTHIFMAYIPDAAIDNSHTLTPSAWRLFCLLCRRRDHRAGVARLYVEQGCERLQLKRSQFFAAQSELLTAGWIEKNERGEFILTGDFAPVEKRLMASDSPENRTPQPENSDSTVRKNGLASPENRTAQSENSDSYNKEVPASLSSTLIQHTHTSPTRARAKPESVGVSAENFSSNGKPQSAFTLGDCLRYAEICKGRGDPIRSTKALASSLHRTGDGDELIRATLYPAQQAAVDVERYGAPRAFTDQPCVVCHGAKMETVAGKGARPCPNCKDERGRSTGKQPQEKGT